MCGKRSLSEKIRPYLYITPMVIVFGVFSLYPILRTFVLSFFDTNAIMSKMDFVGFKNFADMLSDRHFSTVIKNTLIFSISNVIASIVLGLVCAAVANSKLVKVRSLFKTAAFYPYVLPIAVAAMIWIYMYNPTRGAINLLFKSNIQWLSSYDYSLYALIIVSIWKGLGFNFLLILAGMQNISQEFYEAAALETNNAFKRYFKVTLPMLSPTLFLVVLLSVTSSFQSMDVVAIMTAGKPGNASNVLMYYIYQQGIIKGKIGYGSAMSTLLLVILFVFTIVYNKQGEKMVDYER